MSLNKTAVESMWCVVIHAGGGCSVLTHSLENIPVGLAQVPKGCLQGGASL